MSTNFAFNAPQYVDFETITYENEDKEKIEAYFDHDHENPEITVIDSNEFSIGEIEEFFTPFVKDKKENSDGEDSPTIHDIRKSLSMSCLPQDPPELKEEETLCDNLSEVSICSHQSLDKLYRKTGSKLSKKSHYLSRDSFFVAENKGKYVSMAEAINNYQSKTPTRFHSRPKAAPLALTKLAGPIPSTIPHSPALTAKFRHRPVTELSREQREIRDFEEARKFKIKANPVNSKILQGPIKPKVIVEKKPCTTFEPFKITEVTKKMHPPSPKQGVYEFHAKPVPKSVYQHVKPLKKVISSTQSITPKFYKKYTEKIKQAQAQASQVVKDNEPKKPNKLTKTQPKPFSFEDRDHRLLKKKEEFVKKVIEQESASRGFHARPVPQRIFRSPQIKSRSSTLLRGSQESLKSTKSSEENWTAGTVFKARPAKVLYAEPFVPKKEERQLIEITEFDLNTNRRAKEREDFEIKLREKEQQLEEVRKKRVEELRMKDEEEMLILRKTTQYVAKPIRQYKEVARVSPKSLTKPCTPKLATNRLRNKENRNISE